MMILSIIIIVYKEIEMFTKDIDFNNFTLVLAGGSALGIAHLGVIEELEQKGYAPKEIVGTSMGSIIGGCLAIGLCESEIYAIVKKFSKTYKWFSFSFKAKGLISQKKIENMLDDIFGDRQMKDTIIPLKVIATNLYDGSIKVFDQHDKVYIKDALLASSAIPGVFSIKKIDGAYYGDGFINDNLGINETSLQNVLAINVLSHSTPNIPADDFFNQYNGFNLFEHTLRLFMEKQIEYKSSILRDKKIYLLKPNTSKFLMHQFNKYEAIKKCGKNLLD